MWYKIWSDSSALEGFPCACGESLSAGRVPCWPVERDSWFWLDVSDLWGEVSWLEVGILSGNLAIGNSLLILPLPYTTSLWNLGAIGESGSGRLLANWLEEVMGLMISMARTGR